MSFSTTFVFAITPYHSGRSGDGLAFVICAAPDLSTALPGPYLGLVDPYNKFPATNPFFAIELDTAKDLEFKDIDNNHVAVDLNSLKSASSSTAGYYIDIDDDTEGYATEPSFKALRFSNGNPMQVWVDYNSYNGQLDVALAPVPMSKPSLPLLSYSGYSVNLAKFLGFNDTVHVGFSAATGDEHGGTHQILGWSFSMSGPA
uniref:Legume lectin domain-containing protein n=1 Tax=Aegilops tauschii subsp. strangulata TaxID=200361 RepID=A0A453DX96_AEGTS